jgi:hypothetical protein
MGGDASTLNVPKRIGESANPFAHGSVIKPIKKKQNDLRAIGLARHPKETRKEVMLRFQIEV